MIRYVPTEPDPREGQKTPSRATGQYVAMMVDIARREGFYSGCAFGACFASIVLASAIGAAALIWGRWD